MWCVLKCHPGKAEEIMSSCRRNIPNDVLRDIFVFTYDRMKRYQGSWHVERYQMFPDYIFMETQDAAALSEHLKPYREFVQVLEGTDMLWRIQPEEEKFSAGAVRAGSSSGDVRRIYPRRHHPCDPGTSGRNGTKDPENRST